MIVHADGKTEKSKKLVKLLTNDDRRFEVHVNGVMVRHWNFSRGPDGSIRALVAGDHGRAVEVTALAPKKTRYKTEHRPPTYDGEPILGEGDTITAA